LENNALLINVDIPNVGTFHQITYKSHIFNITINFSEKIFHYWEAIKFSMTKESFPKQQQQKQENSNFINDNKKHFL
jgi:hypothetical protein